MNYYEILEVSQNASQEVIKAAYKSLMQRYHPDKNPGNVEIAHHASLVVQAYEILSDLDKRSTYDINFKQQTPGGLFNVQGNSRGSQSNNDSKVRLADKDSKSYWFLWLIIILIVSSGWLILSLSNKKQSSEIELKKIRSSFEDGHLTKELKQDKLNNIGATNSEQPDIIKKEVNVKTEEAAARTIPVLFSKLVVNLRNSVKSSEGYSKSFGYSGHVLSIPELGVVVGTIDSEKVIRHIESKAELIRQKLAEKLADVKYEELIKIDGEIYLKKIILDSIEDTIGTNRSVEFPSSNFESPGRYGVIDTLLPGSFSIQ